MEEYVRKYSNIGLNWYVPNLLNSHVIEMIRNNIHSNPRENRILFNSTELGEFFTISCFELDLKTGQVYTYSTPAEDIGIACQQEEFDIETLWEHFRGQPDKAELDEDELSRIPLIRKKAPTADIMDLEETEEKLRQYCQLWELYAKASCELTKRSKISPEEAANACKVLGPYIRYTDHATVWGGNHHIHDGKGTRRSQKQSTLPHTHNHTTRYKNWKLPIGQKNTRCSGWRNGWNTQQYIRKQKGIWKRSRNS